MHAAQVGTGCRSTRLHCSHRQRQGPLAATCCPYRCCLFYGLLLLHSTGWWKRRKRRTGITATAATAATTTVRRKRKGPCKAIVVVMVNLVVVVFCVWSRRSPSLACDCLDEAKPLRSTFICLCLRGVGNRSSPALLLLLLQQLKQIATAAAAGWRLKLPTAPAVLGVRRRRLPGLSLGLKRISKRLRVETPSCTVDLAVHAKVGGFHFQCTSRIGDHLGEGLILLRYVLGIRTYIVQTDGN